MDRLNEFDILQGFKFFEAHETMADCNDGSVANVIILKFVNEKNVAIEVDFIDGEWHIGEPYAINDDYEPLKKGSD